MRKRNPYFNVCFSCRKQDNNYEAEKYKVYFEERKQLIETAHKSALLYAQNILTLAAGSFGLSFVFIKQVIPEIRPDTIVLLKNAWLCYGVSILSTLLAIFLSQLSLLRQVKIVEYTYYPEQTKMAIINPWDKLVGILSNIAMILFIVGTFCLIYFGLENIYLLGGK